MPALLLWKEVLPSTCMVEFEAYIAPDGNIFRGSYDVTLLITEPC